MRSVPVCLALCLLAVPVTDAGAKKKRTCKSPKVALTKKLCVKKKIEGKAGTATIGSSRDPVTRAQIRSVFIDLTALVPVTCDSPRHGKVADQHLVASAKLKKGKFSETKQEQGNITTTLKGKYTARNKVVIKSISRAIRLPGGGATCTATATGVTLKG